MHSIRFDRSGVHIFQSAHSRGAFVCGFFWSVVITPPNIVKQNSGAGEYVAEKLLFIKSVVDFNVFIIIY